MSRLCRRVIQAWPWVLVGTLCMCVEWAYTFATLTTSSASALCLFYIAPLWAVPMGIVVNRDALHARTIVAMAVALAGISLIFAPNLLATSAQRGTHTHAKPMHGGNAYTAPSSLFGDVCGLVSGLAFAVWTTTCRHASLHMPEAPLAICGAIGSLVAAIPAIMMALETDEDLLDVSPRFVALVVLDSAAITAYNLGTMIASRYLASAELGLYLTLDVVFAPFLVWGVHGEVPTDAVLEGGGLLVSALLAHEAIALITAEATPAPAMSSPKHRNSDIHLEMGDLSKGDEATRQLLPRESPHDAQWRAEEA